MLRTAAADVARLLVPVECPGCGEPDVRLCTECAAAWWGPPLRVETAAPRLDVHDEQSMPVWACVPLDGAEDALVRAWKDGGRRDLDRWLARAMRRAALDAARGWCEVHEVTVVPAPARAAGTRRRGADLPAILAHGVAAGLVDAGLDARVERSLRIGQGDSRGRSARQRWRGAHGGVVTTRSLSGPMVLVDDVVTTGATLAASARALERAGGAAIGAFVAAAAVRARAVPAGGLLWEQDDDESHLRGRGGDAAGAEGAAVTLPRPHGRTR